MNEQCWVDMQNKVEFLMVDDDEMTLFIHEKIMHRCEMKHPFQSFNSAEKCLGYLVADNTPAKLFILLLDINMPGMSGWEMLDRLEPDVKDKEILVIMATSSVDFDDRKRAEKYERVIDFIEKPFSLDTCKNLSNIPQVAALNL